MDANTMAIWLSRSPAWTSLGVLPQIKSLQGRLLITDEEAQRAQAVLDAAQSRANAGEVVLAIKTGSDHGHVALILPGATWPMTGWLPLKPPMSTAMKIGSPKDTLVSYLGRALSRAWKPTDTDGIHLYSHARSIACTVPSNQ